MKHWIAVLAAGTALAGCATAPADMPPPPAETAPTPVAEALPPPKPEYGTFGIDTAGMNTAVQAGDDFYEFANGTWAKNTPIPADKSNYGMFTVLDDLSRQRTRELIENAAKDPNSKIGNAYASFLDTAAIESKGLAPFEPWLNKIRAVKTKAQLDEIYAEANRLGIGGPFGMFVGQDDKAPESYALTMFQSGLGMPDRDITCRTTPSSSRRERSIFST